MLTSALARSWAWLGNTCPSKLQVHHQSGWGLHHFCFYFFKLSPFDRERERKQKQGEWEREMQARPHPPAGSQLDLGLDLRTQ